MASFDVASSIYRAIISGPHVLAGAAAAGVRQQGRSVQLDSIKTRVESAHGVCNQHLKAEYQELLSMSTFNFNLRR